MCQLHSLRSVCPSAAHTQRVRPRRDAKNEKLHVTAGKLARSHEKKVATFYCFFLYSLPAGRRHDDKIDRYVL